MALTLDRSDKELTPAVLARLIVEELFKQNQKRSLLLGGRGIELDEAGIKNCIYGVVKQYWPRIKA